MKSLKLGKFLNNRKLKSLQKVSPLLCSNGGIYINRICFNKILCILVARIHKANKEIQQKGWTHSQAMVNFFGLMGEHRKVLFKHVFHTLHVATLKPSFILICLHVLRVWHTAQFISVAQS